MKTLIIKISGERTVITFIIKLELHSSPKKTKRGSLVLFSLYVLSQVTSSILMPSIISYISVIPRPLCLASTFLSSKSEFPIVQTSYKHLNISMFEIKLITFPIILVRFFCFLSQFMTSPSFTQSHKVIIFDSIIITIIQSPISLDSTS